MKGNRRYKKEKPNDGAFRCSFSTVKSIILNFVTRELPANTNNDLDKCILPDLTVWLSYVSNEHMQG